MTQPIEQDETMTPLTRQRLTRHIRRAAVVAAIGAAGIAIAGGGAAYAYWSTSGTGTGSTAVGTPIALTVTSAGVSGVYPFEKTTVPFTVANYNPFPVNLSSLTLDSVVATGTGCANSNIALDGTATGVSGTTFTVSASLTASSGATPSANFDLPIAVTDLDNNCQGAGHSFSLTVTAHGTSG